MLYEYQSPTHYFSIPQQNSLPRGSLRFLSAKWRAGINWTSWVIRGRQHRCWYRRLDCSPTAAWTWIVDPGQDTCREWPSKICQTQHWLPARLTSCWKFCSPRWDSLPLGRQPPQIAVGRPTGRRAPTQPHSRTATSQNLKRYWSWGFVQPWILLLRWLDFFSHSSTNN